MATRWRHGTNKKAAPKGGLSKTDLKKGQSGNPGGRPKALREVEELARQETAAAMQTLATIHRDKNAPYSARVAAANALLDRAWGKARQAVEIAGDSASPVNNSLTVCFVEAKSQSDE